MNKSKSNFTVIPAKYLSMLPDLKEEKAKKFTTLTLTLIAFIIFGVFAIGPTLSTITDLQKQIDDSQTALQSLTTKITNLTTLHGEYLGLQSDLPYIYAGLPKQANVPEVVGQIQQLAKDDNLQVQYVSASEVELLPQTTASPNQGYSYTLSFNTTGSEDQLLNFISDLTSFNRIITIDNVSLHADDKNPSQEAAGIQAKAYFIP